MVSLVSLSSSNFVLNFLRKVHGTAFRVSKTLANVLTSAEAFAFMLASCGCTGRFSIPWLPLNNLHAGGYKGE
jgi:hypothetical protein